jgi:hypothetical protein
MSSFYIWWGWVENEDQCCSQSIFEEKKRLVLSRHFVKYELWILVIEVLSVWFVWVGVASVGVRVGWFCSHRVGSPLGVWTKAITVLLLCCVLSLRCVIAHVRSVRASPNRGVGLLSGFSTSLSFLGDTEFQRTYCKTTFVGRRKI